MSPDTPALSPPTPCILQPTAAPAKASPTHPLTASDLLDCVVAARDLDKNHCESLPWLWEGYLGAGKVTLLTSQWKSGKTTLIALLLARLQQGGQLAGLAVAPAKAFVITEESEADWHARTEQLGIRDNVDLLCRPFVAQPTMEQWLALIDTAAALERRQGCQLLVVDSLAQFLPAHCENSAGALMECLTPLQRLCKAGMSILLTHHPKKGKTVAGQAARGSGALPSFVNIIIEMGYYTLPDDLDRRRRLVAFSRYNQTPRHLLIELQPDGADYQVLQTGVEAAFSESWQAVLDQLSTAIMKMTRQELLENWPSDYEKPDSSTLWRWLGRAVAQGILCQDGSGTAQHPFRYWLPAREHRMFPENGTPEEQQAWNNLWVEEILGPMDFSRIPFARSKAVKPLPPADPVAATPPAAAPVPAIPTPPAPAPEPEPTGPPTLEEVACLPYPFSMGKVSDIPEHMWKQAREAYAKRKASLKT